MLTDTLTKLFIRDLNKLKDEISAYKSEVDLWLEPKGISNSAGNLCLHIVGNLNHFIGTTLGNSGYVRQRDLEFSLKNIPRLEMIQQIEDTITIIERTLNRLNESDLHKEYRINPFEDFMTTEYFLVHLTTHLSYHLGQINYHRRLLDEM